MKRLADSLIVISISPLVLSFVAILGLLTQMRYRFSPLFTARRVGKEGVIFTCYKLQTMYPTTDTASYFDASKNESRLTRLGRAMRDHGWDELPQLVNIILGDMTFVGPRPIPPEQLPRLIEKYPAKEADIRNWWEKRMAVLPGLSGWHQIHLKDANIIVYDLEFLDDPTIGKSIKILWSSFVILFLGKKRYFGTEIPVTYEYTL